VILIGFLSVGAALCFYVGMLIERHTAWFDDHEVTWETDEPPSNVRRLRDEGGQ